MKKNFIKSALLHRSNPNLILAQTKSSQRSDLPWGLSDEKIIYTVFPSIKNQFDKIFQNKFNIRTTTLRECISKSHFIAFPWQISSQNDHTLTRLHKSEFIPPASAGSLVALCNENHTELRHELLSLHDTQLQITSNIERKIAKYFMDDAMAVHCEKEDNGSFHCNAFRKNRYIHFSSTTAYGIENKIIDLIEDS